MLYRVSHFDLKRIKYSVVQEFDIDLDLTTVFSLKKVHLAVHTEAIEHIWEYKYY